MAIPYDFVIIGGGPGGTPTAMALATAGRRVLLVEKGSGLGGTCLFEGCIPSKIFRESARRLRELRESEAFGLRKASSEVQVDWPTILQRKQAILERRSRAALMRITHIGGLDYRQGTARFITPRRIEVTTADGTREEIDFDQAIVATGSIPKHPPIEGADLPGVIDSEALLDAETIPASLGIIGGGPIGVELGQIFHTLGSQVAILEAAPHILGPVDEELSAQLAQDMRTAGITIETGSRVQAISAHGDGLAIDYRNSAGEERQQVASTVLLVTGRRPNVDGLGLENTAITHDTHGITVDAELQTSEAGIYAVGDVVGQPMFAHWATAQGLALARHLLGLPTAFPTPATNSAVIFSDPELAMAGLTEAQARAAGMDVGVARYDFRQDARAQIAGRDNGLLKIVYRKADHGIVGVHALVEGAADLMGEAAILVKTGLPLEAVASAIHPHPTLTESFAVAARMALSQEAMRAGNE